MTSDSDFYVYAHLRATDGVLFYIGKGHAKRAWSLHRRNPHWNNVATKHGFEVEILRSGMCEADAFNLEKDLIAGFRANGGTLTNMTDGGDGVYSGEKAREVCSKAGKIGGKVTGPVVGRRFAEMKIGVCAPGMASIGGKKGGAVTGKKHAANKTGVCSPEAAFKGGKAAGKKNGTRTKELGIGVHAPGMASAGGKIGGAMPWWVCTQTGRVTRAFTQPGTTFIRGRKCAV